MNDYYPADALPFHYRDNGQPCPNSGTVAPYCPLGCDHAEHYANDGHEACAEDITEFMPRRTDRLART